jgi:SHS2 domain-containing protein
MHEVLQHTADIRIRVVAPTREALFTEAVEALMEAMRPTPPRSLADARDDMSHARDDVIVEAPDLTSLLVDFLGEVLLRCHIRREAYTVARISLTHTTATATLEARAVEGFEDDVKAVTYHEADVRETDNGWTTTLVLDV